MTRKENNTTGRPYGKLKKSVVLIGMMGAGKSSTGKLLAKKIGAPFIDSDTEIEAAAKMSVPEIFELHGEESFRDGERRVFRRLLDGPPSIVASGGGAFVYAPTRQIIQQSAYTVWLKVSHEILLRRVRKRPEKRPLLAKGDIDKTLTRLSGQRSPIYAAADLIIESNDGIRSKIVSAIVDKLENQGILSGSEET